MFELILLILIPVAVIGQLDNLQFETGHQNSDLVKLVSQLVDSKIAENNVKISSELGQKILELESKYDQ